MEYLLYLPDPDPVSVLTKLLFLFLAFVILWWAFTFAYIRIKSAQSGDLKISLCSFWAQVTTFVLLQIFALLLLNYHVSDLGAPIMSDPGFYLRFIPEFVVSAVSFTILLFKRRNILASIDIKKWMAPA